MNEANFSFTAIDFETANRNPNSICQIGLIRVIEGQPLEFYNELVRPPDNRYDQINQEIHGIYPDMTENADTFDVHWNKIKRFFEYQLVVAHNMSFDRNVLLKTLNYYNLPVPCFDVDCTYQIWGYKLSIMCQAFEIEFDHHNAYNDAEACAELYLNYLNGLKPFINPSTIQEIKANKGKPQYHQRISGSVLKPILENCNQQSYFYGKKVVITGVFSCIERFELASRLQSFGADIDTGVTKKINIIITGNDPGPTKMEKVRTYINQGHLIEIMDENTLLSYLEFQ